MDPAVAVMSGIEAIFEFLLLWAATYVLLFGLYLAIRGFVIDPMKAWWDRRQNIRQHRIDTELKIASIEQQSRHAVNQLELAYGQVLQAIRNRADRRWRP